MKNVFALTLFLALALTGSLATGAEPTSRSRLSFDSDWVFLKGDSEGAEQAKVDVSNWRKLDLPHDWGIEGPFDHTNPSGAPGGFLPCGIGWYRKTFTLPEGAEGRKVFVEFDGVAMNGEVWINGKRLGIRPYPYLGYEYELTEHLNFEGENVLAVRVDNSLQPASRWYTGSGIYRHVWLTLTDPIRVGHWGTQVVTQKETKESAAVIVKTTVENGHAEARKITVRQSIRSADGKVVASTESEIDLKGDSEQVVEQSLELKNPAWWSPESPNLYTVRTELATGDKVVDQYDTNFGVRVFHFDAKKGLLFNGESVIMKGVCNHLDLGPLGAALWEDALERRLVMLKEMGCNAIRTAHNPPSPEFLEMCDRLGFLVINETFDEWRRGWAFDPETRNLMSSKNNKGKARFGYNKYFDDWAERDLTDHFRRDRNHASVIMWSVGNEVPEAQKNGELETLKWLRKLCRQLDPSRPMSVGCNFIAGANETGFLELMDVVGYNGGGGSCFLYEIDHKRFPDRKMYASEVPHSLQTRGEYRTHSRYREPEHQPPHLTEEEVFPETDGWYESSYDNAGVRISAMDSWRLTKNLEFFAGEFRWTGFDYIGESGGWPRTLGNFGIIDLCNFPKDTFYFYQSQWADKPMAHLLPHWTWPGKEGVEIPVWCYTTGESVELFLNGKSLGKKEFTEKQDMYLQWMVPYEPGELKAVASRDGKVIATTVQKTAGAPARVVMTPDRTELIKGGRKLSYVTLRIEDAEGNFVPKASNWISLSVQGPGRVLAVGNGDPLSHESFQGTYVKAFNGLALAIIASDETAVESFAEKKERKPELDENAIVLKAHSKWLEPAEASISAE